MDESEKVFNRPTYFYYGGLDMKQTNWKLLGIVAFVLVVSLIFVSVHASETFQVWGGHEITRNIDLTSGDAVTGTLTVHGYASAIDFTITDPDDNAILQYGSTLGTTFSFTAANTGTYTMHFRNQGSTTAEYMIDYSITKFESKPEQIVDMSKDIFYITLLVIAIVMDVLFALIAFRRRKRP